MRINRYIALATGKSRRAADELIKTGRVMVDRETAELGTAVDENSQVQLDGQVLGLPEARLTIMLHKPAGYICSRAGQGGKTIYDLLPTEYHQLKPIGRLDKNSSGLLLLTNDGQLAHELTHPSRQKIKIYEAELNAPLAPLHQQMISDHGLTLKDGLSKLGLEKLDGAQHFRVTMSEGRNRQIRRTFAALGYTVTKLHRTHFGSYQLGNLKTGQFKQLI